MSRCCCTDDMSGVTFPTPVRCNNNQSVNQRCFTVILLCAAFAFVATYFYYGFTEIQNEICNLKEEFYSFDDHIKNMDFESKTVKSGKKNTGCKKYCSSGKCNTKTITEQKSLHDVKSDGTIGDENSQSSLQCDETDYKKSVDDNMKTSVTHSLTYDESSDEENMNCERNYGSDDDDVTPIPKTALLQYDTDKTSRADFALESSGGAIIETRETEMFDSLSRSSLFGIPICPDFNGPRQIIQPGVLPGECWAFKGSSGNVVIKLLGPVFIDGVSIEHISKTISPTGLVDTAPKKFSIWGLTENHPDKLLGEFTYNIDGPTLQSFSICNCSSKSFEYIEFKVHSNHGNRLFTCVYRLQVHGVLDSSNLDY